jgi:hypothetical protein
MPTYYEYYAHCERSVAILAVLFYKVDMGNIY